MRTIFLNWEKFLKFRNVLHKIQHKQNLNFVISSNAIFFSCEHFFQIMNIYCICEKNKTMRLFEIPFLKIQPKFNVFEHSWTFCTILKLFKHFKTRKNKRQKTKGRQLKTLAHNLTHRASNTKRHYFSPVVSSFILRQSLASWRWLLPTEHGLFYWKSFPDTCLLLTLQVGSTCVRCIHHICNQWNIWLP